MKLTTKLLLGATVVAGLSVSAFSACASDVDMGTKNLTNVATPTESHHAATKGYVDEKVGEMFTTTLVCDGTAQSVPSFRSGTFVVSHHHASLFGTSHWGLMRVASNTTGPYITLETNATAFDNAPAPEAAYLLIKSEYQQGGQDGFEYKCNNNYGWRFTSFFTYN